MVMYLPITPARLQGQRWKNWGLTRLRHLPVNEMYTDQEVIDNLEGFQANDQAANDYGTIPLDNDDDIETNEVTSSFEEPFGNNLANHSEEPAPPSNVVDGKPKKTLTTKIAKEKGVEEETFYLMVF